LTHKRTTGRLPAGRRLDARLCSGSSAGGPSAWCRHHFWSGAIACAGCCRSCSCRCCCGFQVVATGRNF